MLTSEKEKPSLELLASEKKKKKMKKPALGILSSASHALGRCDLVVGCRKALSFITNRSIG